MNVRLFIGRLAAVPIVVDDGLLRGLHPALHAVPRRARQAAGVVGLEYTDVHGVCDITHTEELFSALETELALAPPLPPSETFEGVELLRTLMQNIVVNN